MTKEEIIAQIPVHLAPHSLAVAKKRYMKHDTEGHVRETPEEMFYRVAEYMAKADLEYNESEESVSLLTKEFYTILALQKFCPGGRALFEAGNRHTGQLSSCFVIPIEEDSIASIFSTLHDAAIVQKNNGGTGFDFSPIRQKCAAVNGIPNVAAGPIHYIRTFDQAFSQILQGGKRHGGNMGILRVDHPDILEFIHLKDKEGGVKNFNLSVGITREFMECVRADESYNLCDPSTKESVGALRAREVFDLIVKKAWECADPGLIFLDEIEEKNPTPNLFRIVATNPCGEEPLGPYESCNLASINLIQHIKNNQIQWDDMANTIYLAIHFLDNMIDQSEFPLQKIRDAVSKTRKLGLGIMGFGQMLFELGIPYNSDEAVLLCEKITRFVEEKAIEESLRLAALRGVFPAYSGSSWEKKGLRTRNATLTSIAPTGTISILANTSSGIEPVFSLATERKMFYENNGNHSGGLTTLVVDPIFERVSKARGFYSEELIRRIASVGTIQHMEDIPEDVRNIFVTTHDIHYSWHVKMQAMAQKWTDAAVSKTINFPNDASLEDIRRAYILAYESHCKGITIYRDGSKQEQVLSTGNILQPQKNISVEEKNCWNDNPLITSNAFTVLEKRALKKNEEGEVGETVNQCFKRVASRIADVEDAYNISPEKKTEIQNKFFEILSGLEFIPGQALRNSGSDDLTLSACLVLPIEDSIESIMRTSMENVIAHKATCGTGMNFSALRPRGAQVGAVGPIAAGPVAFMRSISVAQKTVQTKGGRGQGSMGILNVDHPDIEEFISCKDADDGSFDNMNISVGLTDRFMEALKNNEEYEQLNPYTSETVRSVFASQIFEKITAHAWKTGDPGLIFIDRINADNPTPTLGKINSTNVCGEQPLLPYETCNLGSIVLSRVLCGEGDKKVIDWEKFAEIIYYAVRFLDNTIDANQYPLEKIDVMSKKTRRIGLGVMGYADMLVLMGISYNSEKAIELAEEIMKFVSEKSHEASMRIAEEKGSFPAFSESVWARRGCAHMRNSAVTTIAPTGYTSIVANCSSGVEPIFALAYRRENSMGGHNQIEIHSEFKRILEERGLYNENLMEEVLEKGSIQHIESLPQDLKDIFSVSYDIEPQWDVRIQAAFQKYTDNAVSKTINFRNTATVDDIKNVFRLAYDLGCKGITIYRDGSKKLQVLNMGTKKKEEVKEKRSEVMLSKIETRKRPEAVSGITYEIKTGYGDLYVTVNHDVDGRMFEVFATIGRTGGVFAAKSEAICRLISLALRSGLDPEALIKQLKGIRGPMPIWSKRGMVLSIPDAISQIMMEDLAAHQQKLDLAFSMEKGTMKEIADTELEAVENVFSSSPQKTQEEILVHNEKKIFYGTRSIAATGMSPECPDCATILEFSEGCMTCRACGYSKCG